MMGIVKTKPAQYNPGDRVTERPISRPSLGRTNQLKAVQGGRTGTVLELTTKLNKRKAREKFLVIQWDHLQQPSTHAQMRICHLSEHKELQERACHVIG